jgi:hypothetical protein
MEQLGIIGLLEQQKICGGVAYGNSIWVANGDNESIFTSSN